MMIQKALVPVDGSSHMSGLVAKAIDFAKKTGCTLTFLYVVNMPPTATASEVEKQKAACIRIPEECMEKAASQGVSAVFSTVEVGPPGDTIINVAEGGKYDLIIIGSKGHSSLKTLLVGNVADKVMEHSPCPVLLSK